ncbi:MAG TPA: hypothetical protein DEV72_07960 [Ktedonobacter sp.]|nr:hypothetical protein [Ktedonobacter sp.]
MQKNFKGYIFFFLTLAALLGSVFAAGFVFATGQTTSTLRGSGGASARPAIAPMVSTYTVNMRDVPAATTRSLSNPTKIEPWHAGVSSTVYTHRKELAAQNKFAPFDAHPFTATNSFSPHLPSLTSKFQGMSDSPSICPIFGHCRHPDMALATSPNWVLQGVNEAWAVYNTTGTIQTGWPKNYQKFFGVPNPPNNCDTLPYMVDVRAFYDPADGRFWATMLQDEGAYGYNNCPFKALYWIAVSATNNPNGAWHVYSFDMALGTKNPVDFTQFGFDAQAIYFSGNMLDLSGNTFKYAEVFAADKSKMEVGAAVTPKGFKQLQSGSTLVDSVQPVETEALGSGAPGAELLISSFNVNSGGGSCVSGCSGVVVWAFANPLNSPALTDVVVSTPQYALPPFADEPGCKRCIETFDTRIGATPVYNNGKISFALETAVNNGIQVVPGIFWGQVKPTLKGGNITGATLYQSGILSFAGDQAASFGAVMDDKADSLFMVFATMSSSLKPGSMYTVHRTTDPLGTLETPKFLMQGQAPKTQQYYGDFEATSYDGSGANHTWLASEYTGSNGDWSTIIAKV